MLPFRFELGLELVVPTDLDTDALGTFTGEVERAGTPEQVCLRKARLGMVATGLKFGVANEGSFGPHPYLFFVAADIEFMTFVDDQNGFVVTESLICERTNYGRRDVRTVGELADWLPSIGFPEHALIVRPRCGQSGCAIAKGIRTIDHLEAALARAIGSSADGMATVEPDMRAHLNPLRLAAIQRLGFRLARRVASPCPVCSAPGWGRTGSVAGLPCQRCGGSTAMIEQEVFSCTACAHREERPRRDGLVGAPPERCPYCNP